MRGSASPCRPGALAAGGPLAALLVLACLAPGACRGQTAAPTLRVAHESRLMSLDPTLVVEPVTASVLANVFEALVAFDGEMRLLPALATRWSAPDDRTWVFDLRPRVRFHGGQPLRAADVKFTLDRARHDPASGYQGRLAAIEEVEVLSEASLRVRTRRPDPLLLNRLAQIGILPEGRVPGEQSLPEGTGPYRVVGWRADEALELEAFEGYWGKAPSVRRVRFLEIGAAGALPALRARDVDVLRGLPHTALPALRRLGGFRLESQPALEQHYLWIDSRGQPGGANPFADVRVRQALSLAIDREALAAILGNQAAAAHQLAPPGVFGYLPDLPPLAFDPQRARQLLREAGFPSGFSTHLVRRASEDEGPVAAELARRLERVGVRVEVDAADWQVMFAAWEASRLPFFLAGWRFDEGDALGFLQDCLETRDPARPYGSFNPGYGDPRLDALLEENGALLQPGLRREQYELLMRHAHERLPLVPLYRAFDLYAVAARVRFTPRLDGRLLVAEMAVEP